MSALAQTSASIWPKRIPIKNDLAIRTISMKRVDDKAENHIS